MADRHEKIRERAYAIWLDQGSGHGRDNEHWLEAEKEIVREEATSEPKGGEAIVSDPNKTAISADRLNASNDK